MPEALANSTVALLVFGLVITALIVSVIGLESEQTRAYLRRQPWFRRFEQLGPSELRFRGMVSLGVGLCLFGALLSLRLWPDVGLWPALALGVLSIVAITLGAALLERAEQS